MPNTETQANRLTEQQIAQYHRDGYLVLPGLFDAAELEPLRRAYYDDPTINGHIYGMEDRQGKGHPICSWTELGEDIIGIIPRLARMIDAAEALLGGECYHWHSKFSVKTSTCGARVDWHQDYASWYFEGLMFPDLLTIGIAIEPATRANGCLQLVPGSHHMGRIGAELFDERLAASRERLGVTHAELDAGDAVVFHSNTLHGSGLNATDQQRIMIFVTYNARANAPLTGLEGTNLEGAFMGIDTAERAYRPMAKLDDGVLARGEFKSAFSHSPIHTPNMALGADYYRAVPVET